MNSIARAVAPRRGRPRKFARPSRAVTLTLPEEVIDALSAIDEDLSRAVVRIAQPELGKPRRPAAELSTFGRHAVVVVPLVRALELRTGAMLVPLSDGRALISFDEPLSIAQLELRIQDAIDDPRLPRDDVRIFEDIGRLLRDARRDPNVAVQQRHIIVLESRNTKRKSSSSTP